MALLERAGAVRVRKPTTSTPDAQCSRGPGLLSKGNRDLHTTRSAEVPHLGGVFCAERTREHEALYLDGKEAVFWSDAAECAAACKALLDDAPLRRSMAAAGRVRCIANGTLNETVAEQVLQRVAQRGTAGQVAA